MLRTRLSSNALGPCGWRPLHVRYVTLGRDAVPRSTVCRTLSSAPSTDDRINSIGRAASLLVAVACRTSSTSTLYATPPATPSHCAICAPDTAGHTSASTLEASTASRNPLPGMQHLQRVPQLVPRLRHVALRRIADHLLIPGEGDRISVRSREQGVVALQRRQR